MLSIGAIPGSGGKYYTGGKYYDAGKPDSKWGGGAKDILGLPDGPVSGKDLDRLFAGFAPDGTRLFPERKIARYPGHDETFNAPKSLSLLAIGCEGQKYKDLHLSAVEKAMAFRESHLAQTRIYNRETGKQDNVGGQKILYGLITEMTSRSNDVHLHTHTAVINLAIGEDGKVRSLNNNRMVTHKVLGGLVYRSHIARGLKTMGHELRYAGKYDMFEVKGVREELIELFSKRRVQMLEMTQGQTRTPETMAKVALISRPSKESIEKSLLLDMWKAEAKEHGFDLEVLAPQSRDKAQQNFPVTKEAALESTLKDIAETNSEFTFLDILKAGLIKHGRDVTPDEFIIAIKERVASGRLIDYGEMELYSTSNQIARDKAVKSEWQKGKYKGGIIPHDSLADLESRFATLSGGQRDAARLALSSPDRVVAVQGMAGTGKTYMLETVLPIAKQAGMTTIGIAPTGGAVVELESTGQFDKTMTMQQFLLTPEGNSSTILVLDEASMAGTKDMLQLIHFANSKNMPRFLLVGDRNQLSAVAAGRPFADLQDSGMRTAHMTEIIRQISERHRKGVGELATDKVREAFKTLAPEFHEIEKDKLYTHARELWALKGNPKTPIIVQTNRQKQDLNALVKAEVQKRLDQTQAGQFHKIWRPVHLSDEAKRDARSFHAASHVRFNRDYKRLGISRGDVFKIRSINEKAASLNLQSGTKNVTFRPAQYNFGKGAIEAYRQEEIELNKGDRIRFTRGGKDRPVNNHDMAIVSAVSSKAVTFEMDNDKSVTMKTTDPAIRHLDHGWANTTHAFQGKTVDDVILVIPSQANPLLSINSLYTGASRHRHGLAMVTDNVERLRMNIEDKLDLEIKQMKIVRQEPKPIEPERSPEIASTEVEQDTSMERSRSDRGR